jgi:DNA topoisomerase-1
VKLVVTEKNIAAQKISQFLGAGRPKNDKVYTIPVYRFTREGEDWVAIGLKGHILGADFPAQLTYHKKSGWQGLTDEGELIPAAIPDGLAKPPYKRKRLPYMKDGIALNKWRIDALPYLIYAPIVKYPAEKGIIRALKNLAKKADDVIIATDFDREGELIGYDAMHMVREVNPDVPIRRARFSAITKQEISRAFSELTDIDEELAHAGESRQFIDLIWGAALTRYLTTISRGGMGKVRSAGRVQTPTLALVVDRERQRLAFVPEDYWQIKGSFRKGDEGFTAMHAQGRFKEEAPAKAAMARVQGEDTAIVSDVQKKSRKQMPPAPFNTTSLMAAAAAEGISPGRAMRIAETLYMNGLTSYPRVDNTVYPASLDLRGTVRMLSGNPAYAPYCSKLLAKDKLTVTRGKTETTDHPPIHPTGVADPGKLKPAEWKLYNLIARRFLATLSGPATIEATKIVLDVAGEPFSVRGDVLVEPGFREIYRYGLKKDEQLPLLAKADEVDFLGAELQQKQTEPPARYSQGKLIQDMEKAGLGTKSTRHTAIDRLYQVEYVQNDPIEPTQLGMAIIEGLEKYAPHIASPEMTADLEKGMDAIAAGESSQDVVVNRSRDMLAGIMDDLIPLQKEMGETIADAVAADARVGQCPTCGKDLLAKHSAKNNSNFVGCSGWPDCDVTFPLPSGFRSLEVVEEPCPQCAMPQVKVHPYRGKAYVHCLNPECPTNVEQDLDVGPCPVCSAAGHEGRLIAQKNPRTLKRFIRCTNHEECGTSYPLPGRGELSYEGEVCEACGAPKVVVTTNRGPWHLCPNPECPSRSEEDRSRAARRSSRKAASGKSPAKARGRRGKVAEEA